MNVKELRRLIKEEISKAVKEDKSKKRGFLGIFNPDKNTFQRVIKKVDPEFVKDLIQYTKSNGDDVEKFGNSTWGITKESGEDDQGIWQYSDGNLMFINLKYPSIYDDYIRKNS